jgi:branched-subunit amino acid transport protein
MNQVQNLWGREPAMVIGAIMALIALATGFGLDISGEQQALISAAVAAVLSVVTRSQVSPVKTSQPEVA